jgi:hypothetical protein
MPSARTVLSSLSALLLAGCAVSATKPTLSGRYAANTAASRLLPGDEVPRDFVMEIVDDGDTVATTQTFTATDGKNVRLTWRGACDGMQRPVEGALMPMQMSCRRAADGALINSVAIGPLTYTETCRLTNPEQLVCAGEMPAVDGPARPFSYAFDRL